MGKRVVIVGGGIIGLCSAYYSVRAGHEVTIIERDAPDHECCCGGNAGMIVPSHFTPLAAPGMVATGLKMMANPRSPFYIKPRLSWELADWGMKFVAASTHRQAEAAGHVLRDLHLASRALFLELAADKSFKFGLKQNGLLMLCKSPDTLAEETEAVHQARALGIPAEVLTAEETAKLDPSVNMDICGAVYFPQDCHLEPRRLLGALTEFLKTAGVEFRWQQNVNDWRIDDGRITAANADGDLVEGDEFVIAGGSYSPALARPLKLHLPMQAGKGYSVTLKKPTQLPKICSILTEARVAVTPMGGSLRFGGTMEIAGLDKSINAERVQGIVDSAAKYFPAFDSSHFEGLPAWSGLRPCSPDGLPYIGRSTRARNLIVATGHAMLGLSLGPITGKMVGQIIGNENIEVNSPLISPDRFLGF
ncbi:MAG: NAD(P)/FAD-dependent oxidoreductase [Limisphaerales bacterium]